jgi:di/tricarboxylate transporter
MFVVSIAINETGLANLIAVSVSGFSNQGGLVYLAVISFLLSAVITQLVGGQVAAFIAAPVTLGAAISAGINPQAVAVATAIGCSASFLLPLAHPVNIMMIGPGNYRMIDFFKVGVWLTLVSLLGLILAMVLFW